MWYLIVSIPDHCCLSYFVVTVGGGGNGEYCCCSHRVSDVYDWSWLLDLVLCALSSLVIIQGFFLHGKGP